MQSRSEPRISWQIEEYSHRDKTPDWYWALGVIAVTIAIIAVIYHDALFAVLIIIGSIMMGYYAAKEPDIVEISISEDGITAKDFFYPFEKIKGFTVEEHALGNTLLFESNRSIAPIVSIPIPEGLDTEGLYELLKTKLVEKPITEPAAHKIMEHIGF